MDWHRERPERTSGDLGAEYFMRASGSAFVNESGEPINGWVSIRTGHSVPRIRRTQAIDARSWFVIQVSL